MGTVSLSLSIMKFLTIVTCFGLAVGSTVKREAEPEAEAQFGFGIHEHRGAYSSAPECTFTPVKDCKTRDIEHPKKVCQTVVDKHEDTVVTEECEETITTVCTQTSTDTQLSSSIKDKSSTLVEEGVARPITEIQTNARSFGHPHFWKREAEPKAEPGFGRIGFGRHISVPLRNINHPDCTSTPVKTCKDVPVTRPRVVSRVVCETVVDVTTVEDCKKTVTKTCASSDTYTAHHTKVTGHSKQVIGS